VSSPSVQKMLWLYDHFITARWHGRCDSAPLSRRRAEDRDRWPASARWSGV